MAVKLNELNISQVTEKSILEARKWFEELPGTLSNQQGEIAARILKEINDRLGFLIDVLRFLIDCL